MNTAATPERDGLVPDRWDCSVARYDPDRSSEPSRGAEAEPNPISGRESGVRPAPEPRIQGFDPQRDPALRRTPAPGLPICVLVVDDTPSDSHLVEVAFSRVAPHIRLQLARDGEEAIRLLTECLENPSPRAAPCLVLLDLNLPRKSGFDVLEWIRRSAGFSELPVMILSSSTRPDDIRRARSLGADGYYVKPMDLRSLTEIVRGLGAHISALRAPWAGPDGGGPPVQRA